MGSPMRSLGWKKDGSDTVTSPVRSSARGAGQREIVLGHLDLGQLARDGHRAAARRERDQQRRPHEPPPK
jgi:hypothetical protein